MSLSRLYLLSCLSNAVTGALIIAFAPDDYYRAGYALFPVALLFFGAWCNEERRGE